MLFSSKCFSLEVNHKGDEGSSRPCTIVFSIVQVPIPYSFFFEKREAQKHLEKRTPCFVWVISKFSVLDL